MIIDVHSHLYRSNSSAASWWLAGEPDGPVPVARYVAHAVASAVALAPGRLVGQCQVLPRLIEASLAEMERHIARGAMRGIGELCQYARFIMAHIGGMSNWWNGIDVSRGRDNVWVDTSGFVLLCHGALRRALVTLGPSKILFGVDFPLVPAAALLAALDSETLRSDERERIVSGNAVELFRLNGEGDPC